MWKKKGKKESWRQGNTSSGFFKICFVMVDAISTSFIRLIIHLTSRIRIDTDTALKLLSYVV